MNENSVCQYCNNILSNRGFYCPSCGKQIRCKNCKELLEVNANVCVICGSFVSDEVFRGSDFNQSSIKQPQSVLNTFEYRETQNSKTLKANFSDAVGNSLNETLNNFLDNRFLPVGVRKPVVKESALEPLMQLPSGDLPISDDATIKKSSSEPIGVINMFEKIFRLQDQELILLEPRIKAKNKLEYSKKLAILVIYYFNLVSIRKLFLARPGHRPCEQMRASFLISCTSGWQYCGVLPASPKFSQPPSGGRGSFFRPV